MGVSNDVRPLGKRIRHFVGAESSKQLAFIDDLHKLGLSRTVDLPELIVIGDQNTGKSSVLQAITEISFPVESALCTRFPIKISFRQEPKTTTTVKAEILAGATSQNDQELLERIKDFQFTSNELSADTMTQIVKEATDLIFNHKDESNGYTGQGLSDATLCITRSGPNEMHWTIVDLPGLVQNRGHSRSKSKKLAPNGDGYEDHLNNAVMAKNLVQSLLKNERHIVLWVVDDTDIERHKALELFHGDEGEKLKSRTIGVLTKCDRKQETSDNWMLKLLRDELTNIPKLDQGWFCLRNRKPIEANISDEERDENERALFRKPEWEGVPSGRTGIKALMDYVDKVRRAQIQESMPKIISEIQHNLYACEAELEKLGDVRDSTAAQRHYAFQFCIELQNMADSALRGRYQDIGLDNENTRLRYIVSERLNNFREELVGSDSAQFPFGNIDDDLNRLYAENPDPSQWSNIILNDPKTIYVEIYKESLICQGTNLPGNIMPEVEEKIFRKQSSHWKDIASKLVDDIKTQVKKCHSIFLKHAIPDSGTRGKIIALTADANDAWDAEVNAALTELIDDNRKRQPITYNPYFLNQSQHLDSVLFEKIEYIMKNKSANTATDEDSTTFDGSKLRLPLELIQFFHVRERLCLYYGIALWRFVDNVAMQVVERHILGPNSPIHAVSTKLLAGLNDDDLKRIAGEDESVTQQRQKLNNDKARYKKALAQWEQVRAL